MRTVTCVNTQQPKRITIKKQTNRKDDVPAEADGPWRRHEHRPKRHKTKFLYPPGLRSGVLTFPAVASRRSSHLPAQVTHCCASLFFKYSTSDTARSPWHLPQKKEEKEKEFLFHRFSPLPRADGSTRRDLHRRQIRYSVPTSLFPCHSSCLSVQPLSRCSVFVSRPVMHAHNLQNAFREDI